VRYSLLPLQGLNPVSEEWKDPVEDPSIERPSDGEVLRVLLVGEAEWFAMK
jgi:hypothetical protein